MKAFDVIVKIIEASVYYVGVIDVYFLVLVGQFVVAFNTYLHVINLVLYIFCILLVG